jgi:hypothetical protein
MDKIKELEATLAKSAELADGLVQQFPACSSAVSVRGRINHVTEMLGSLKREIAAQPKSEAKAQ